MESPFTELLVPEGISYGTPELELELANPLLDPEQFETGTPVFDLPKAIAANKQFGEKLWQDQLHSIIAYFFSKGLISNPNLLDPVNFAMAGYTIQKQIRH